MKEYSAQQCADGAPGFWLSAPPPLYALVQVVQGTVYIPSTDVGSLNVFLYTHFLASAFNKVQLVDFLLVSLSCNPQRLH